ncbi:hypothetical protein ID866_4051 [Astraeus odoratus]|nr:hypothetical protein ID866_4051 [Astraeus odoratus]
MSPSVVSPSTSYSNSNHNDVHDNVTVDRPSAKISAYYSLVFPNMTFYLQTLSVTIGRRCNPLASSSASGGDGATLNYSPVDVDLGPLKSVSRLHARIEYEEEEERFVLVVIGRNGAWVDGVWSSAGSRVPLSERSQIQIASRTFHFVLPPPSVPEDSPSPSSNSSIPRARSPSVDITSLSPPSSLPSHSPPPREAPSRPPLKHSPSPEPQLPNSNAISRSTTKSAVTPCVPHSVTAPTSKKRKKLAQSVPKPEVMPPKPPFTYAHLCYRAIKAMGGKATLQDICGWMIDNYDWYRYNEGAGWENSVRHNLSSGRAFKKMERSTGEHGKGFFWSVDEQYEHTFEEQEAKAQAQSLAQTQPSQGQAVTGGKDGKKKKSTPLDPPLKRSVKTGNAPLPPPLTSTPLPLPSRAPNAIMSSALTTSVSVVGESIRAQESGGTPTPGHQAVKVEPIEPTRIGASVGNQSEVTSTATSVSTAPAANVANVNPTSSTAGPAAPATVSPLSALPASVCLPIVVGTVPSSSSAPASTEDPAPIILHNNTLVLSPLIFSSLTPDQLKALEEMGAQRALEVLQGHIVRYLKERMGRRKKRKAAGDKGARKGDTKVESIERSSPFTTAPLPSRNGQTAPQPQTSTPQAISASSPSHSSLAIQPDFRIDGTNRAVPDSAEVKESVPVYVDSKPPVPVPIQSTANAGPHATSGSSSQRPPSPIIVVDDEDDEVGRAVKKRRIDAPGIGQTPKNLCHQISPGVDVSPHIGTTVQVMQPGDEDIEIDVC